MSDNDADKLYNVFHRTWWKDAETPGWPNNLEPCPGEKHYLAEEVTWTEARQLCQEWNSKHKPGRYSDKAEFEEAE